MGWGSGITRFGLNNSENTVQFDGVLYSLDYEEINAGGVVQQELIKLVPVVNDSFTSWANVGADAPASSNGIWTLGSVQQGDQWVLAA